MHHAPDDLPKALTLRTLGAASLTSGPGGDLLLAPGKPLALLVFMALAPGRRTSRESLIDLLWSDVDPDRARNALRQSLFHLRRLLGDDAIAGTEELTLLRPMTVDRDAFLVALEAQDLAAALTLYHGPFLPAFGVPGGAAFEQWADLERERLEAGFLRGAELLVRRWLNEARITEARQLARRVRDVLPHVEAAGRLVLEASVAGRDFVSAAMDANALEQWAVAEELVLEPSTRAAIARARRVAPSAQQEQESVTLVAELTGREQEFFTITSAWEAVRVGPARHLHVSAPAGFGKTRLLRDAVARLEAGGATVVQLRGKPGDREVPYAFVGDMAAAIAELPGAAGVAPASVSTLLALAPALASRLTAITSAADAAIGDDALRRRILALTDLVHSVADEQRFVLAIDDLHWIDPLSYGVLEGLWGRLNRAHVLCLTASRPERDPVSDVCPRLPLAALTERQMGALVSALGSLPPDEPWANTFAARLHDATRGSPLLLLETLHVAIAQDILVLSNGQWRCLDTTRLTALLRAGEALRERVRTLPAPVLSVLALLATAGTPLERPALANAAAVSRETLSEWLELLERQGLVTRTGGGIMPAHDAIAEAALSTLSHTQRSETERRIGTLFERAGGTTNGLLRAARHFEAAGDDRAVQRLFRDYVQQARARGDRRAFTALATELLGPSEASVPTKSSRDRPARGVMLAQTLPVAWRLGLWSTFRQIVAAASLLLVPMMAVAYARGRAAVQEAQQRLVLVDSASTTRAVIVHPDQWDSQGAPLLMTEARSAFSSVVRRNSESPPVLSPDRRSVAWTEDSGDSTTLDIWIRTPAGVRRLTHQRGDDRVSGWLPDGSALVGLTDRWSTPGSLGYDVAVFDTSTGAARAIARSPDHDGGAMPSPDGTRVAFIRESDAFPPRFCVATIDGVGTPDCRLVDAQSAVQLLGWSGLDELVLIVDGPDTRPLIAYDWIRHTSRLLLGPHAGAGSLSPDRRWVTAALRVDGIRGARRWIAPVDRPADARPLNVPGLAVTAWWEGREDHSALIDRLEFADSTTVIPLGMGTRMRVRSLTAAGVEVPLRAPMQWTSSDTTVAVVDANGEVRPRTDGTTTVTASLVGRRRVQRELRVVGEPPTTVLAETWDARWPSRWLTWGDPTPVVVTGPAGVRALWNRGDGSYPSMAVLRRGVSARHGLGVEVRIATPITTIKWQRLRVILVAGLDTAMLKAGDQRKAPASIGSSEATCGMSFPGSGTWGASRMGALASMGKDLELGAVADTMRTGAWWTLRVQILPDGRCGIAINHRVVWLSTEPMLIDGEFRLRLGDESADTQLLHGPLQLWTGVRTDIDWTPSVRR
jgi:DNA-binding SARP family transcriptional activator